MSFTPIVEKQQNRQETNSLRLNSTVNRLLCLIRNQPEVNCAWLVYVRARKTYNRLSGRVPLILSRGGSVHPEDEIKNEDDHDDDENTAVMEDALSDGLGDNLSNVLSNNP